MLESVDFTGVGLVGEVSFLVQDTWKGFVPWNTYFFLQCPKTEPMGGKLVKHILARLLADESMLVLTIQSAEYCVPLAD